MLKDFLGAERILTAEGKLKKVPRKRVGLIGMKAPARQVETHSGLYFLIVS